MNTSRSASIVVEDSGVAVYLYESGLSQPIVLLAEDYDSALFKARAWIEK